MKRSRDGESSKRAEKRSKRLQQTIIAANLQEGSVGIRISTGDSTSQPHVSPNRGVDEALQVRKKKTRGPSRLKFDDEGTTQRTHVDWNEHGQPVGHSSAQFSTQIGVIVRKFVPVTLNSWAHLPEQLEDDLWTCVQKRFIIDDCHKKITIQMMGRMWRNYKSTLTSKITELAESIDVATELERLKPHNLDQSDWEVFVKTRNSLDFKERSKKFKEIRVKQTISHTMSRRGYARLEDEMKKQSPTPSTVSRVDVWVRAHTRKNGKPINEAVDETMRKMQEYSQTSSTQGTSSLQEDAVAHVLGPERPGRVRGLGFGVTPSKVDTLKQQSGRVKKLEDEIHNLNQQLNELRAVLVLQGMRQNVGQSGGDEDTATQSSEATL